MPCHRNTLIVGFKPCFVMTTQLYQFSVWEIMGIDSGSTEWLFPTGFQLEFKVDFAERGKNRKKTLEAEERKQTTLLIQHRVLDI